MNNAIANNKKKTVSYNTQFILDPKSGVPYLETICHLCGEENILRFKADKKKYKCQRCKKQMITLKEQREK